MKESTRGAREDGTSENCDTPFVFLNVEGSTIIQVEGLSVTAPNTWA